MSRIVLLVITAVVGYYVVENREWIASYVDSLLAKAAPRENLKDQGIALIKQGKYKEAEKVLENAYCEAPGDESLKNLLASTRLKMVETPSAALVTSPTQTSVACSSASASSSEVVKLDSKLATQTAQLAQTAAKANPNNVTASNLRTPIDNARGNDARAARPNPNADMARARRTPVPPQPPRAAAARPRNPPRFVHSWP
ncbi:MAG: hypothetical protein NTX50_12655 [Candidatus Sumerlaeota bacterium]|nr:hypothetical protein [Candidatus Sumerlaeota bacterium]